MHITLKYITFLSLFLVLIGCKKTVEPIANVIPITDHQTQKISMYLQSVVNNHDLPGISVNILNSGKKSSYFKKNTTSKDTTTISDKAVFNSLELSELFVATAIMKLKNEGLLSLTDPVVKHLPYFTLRDSIRSGKINIHQLLTQTSGLPIVSVDITKNTDVKGALEGTTKSISNLEQMFNAGAKYKQTFLNYDILADVISKVSGVPFEEYLKKEILEPLNMKTATYDFKAIDSTSLHTPYQKENLKVSKLDYYPFNKENIGSNGLHANGSELLNWTEMLLNNGEYNNTTFLKEENASLLLKPKHDIGEKKYIGYAWIIEEVDSSYVNFKSFQKNGFSGSVTLYPKHDMAIVVQTNMTATFPINTVTKNIIDYLKNDAKEIEKISKPMAPYLVNAYDEGGVAKTLEVFNTLKGDKNVRYDSSLDTFVLAIHHILNSATKETKEQKQQEILEVLAFCDEEYPKSPMVAISYADSYLVFNDTIKVNSYLDKAIELSNNDKGVIEEAAKMRKKMRSTEVVEDHGNIKIPSAE